MSEERQGEGKGEGGEGKGKGDTRNTRRELSMASSRDDDRRVYR